MNRDALIVNDLYKFYKAFVVSKYGEIVSAPHIKSLSRYLMRMSRGDLSRLVVNMAPQHSKSSMITLAYPFWLIMRDPDTKILIVNNSDGLSETFGLQIRDLFRRYQDYFGVYLSEDKSSNKYMMFQNQKKGGDNYEGSIRLVGAGSSKITGTPVDYIIIDDPYEGFGDTTPSLLQKKIDWFNTIILQRLREESRMVILHTRWSQNDLSGYLKRNYPDQYTFVEYPAIKEDGNPLWNYYTLDTLNQRRKEMGDRLFEAIYQQKPLDLTSDFFDMEQIKFNEEPNDIIASIWAYDLAYSEVDQADYTVGIKMLKSENDTYYITDMIRGKFGNRNKEMVLRNARHDPNTPIGIEFGVAAAGKLLAHEWRSYLHEYSVKEIVPIRNKEDRAFPLSNTIADGNLVVNLQGKKLEDWMREIASFPNGVHDDIVDATSHAHNLLRRKRKHNFNDYIIEI